MPNRNPKTRKKRNKTGSGDHGPPPRIIGGRHDSGARPSRRQAPIHRRCHDAGNLERHYHRGDAPTVGNKMIVSRFSPRWRKSHILGPWPRSPHIPRQAINRGMNWKGSPALSLSDREDGAEDMDRTGSLILEAEGRAAFCPHPAILLFRPDRKQPYALDARRYRGRNGIERMFARLKDLRRIAARYDKKAENVMAAYVSPQSSAAGFEMEVRAIAERFQPFPEEVRIGQVSLYLRD